MPSVDAGKNRSVLFLDDEGWDSFEQMAVALRRRGVRTVRASTVPPARLQRLLKEPHFRWLGERLAYDELIHLGSADGRARLQDLLGRGEVADVVANEPALVQLGMDTPLGRSLTTRSLAFRGTPAEILLDKFEVNAALARAGVATPRQIRVCDVSPAEAVAQLGLPLWIKRPIGASREQVRTAHDLGEVAAHLKALGADGGSLFYQEHVAGPVIIYGAVLGADGALVEALLRLEPTANAVRLDDNPELLAAGRKAANLFRPRGFASFAFIETVDGRHVHIAANIRPWGTIAAPLGLGVDFAETYAALVLERPPGIQTVRGAPAKPLPVFPHRVLAAAEAGEIGAAVSGGAALVRTFAAPLGLPYCGYILARAPLLAFRGRRDRRASTPVTPQAAPTTGTAASTPA